MYPLLKRLLFSLEPEKAHHFTVNMFGFAVKVPLIKQILETLYNYNHSSLPKILVGLNFKNPVGLAAGFDKDGKYIDRMRHLGFGFIELGTVTPKAQKGNPQPRLFRLPKDEALINRMGFNNDGVDALVERLKNFEKGDLIVGGNIGKNKITPNDQAVDDYIICFNKLHPYVDYFVVNVSSPNTPGLRELQEKDALLHILSSLSILNQKLEQPRPIFLKIAPDLNNHQIDDIIENVLSANISGIIATNTTISRSDLLTDSTKIDQIGNGGLSGKPVADRSTEIIKYLRQKAGNELAIIGVGGIDSPEKALEKIKAGADLIQIYTGLIYKGPNLIKNINQAIAKKSPTQN